MFPKRFTSRRSLRSKSTKTLQSSNNNINININDDDDDERVDPSLATCGGTLAIDRRLNCIGGGGRDSSKRNHEDNMDTTVGVNNSPISRCEPEGEGQHHNYDNNNNNDDDNSNYYDPDDRFGASSLMSGISAPSLDGGESLYTAAFSYNAGYMKDDDDVSSMNSASIVGRAITGSRGHNHNISNRYESSSSEEDDDDEEDREKDVIVQKKNPNINHNEEKEEDFLHDNTSNKNASSTLAVLGVTAPPNSYKYQYDLEEDDDDNIVGQSKKHHHSRPPLGYNNNNNKSSNNNKVGGNNSNKNSLGKLAVAAGALTGNPTAIIAKVQPTTNTSSATTTTTNTTTTTTNNNDNHTEVVDLDDVDLVDDDDDYDEDEEMRLGGDVEGNHHGGGRKAASTTSGSVVSGCYSEDGDICSIIDDGVLSFVDIQPPPPRLRQQQQQPKVSSSSDVQSNNRTTVPPITTTSPMESVSMIMGRHQHQQEEPPLRSCDAGSNINNYDIGNNDPPTIKILKARDTNNKNSHYKISPSGVASPTDETPISTTSSNDEENSNDDVISLTRMDPHRPVSISTGNSDDDNRNKNVSYFCCCLPKWIQRAPGRLKLLLFVGILLLSGSIALVALGLISEFQSDDDDTTTTTTTNTTSTNNASPPTTAESSDSALPGQQNQNATQTNQPQPQTQPEVQTPSVPQQQPSDTGYNNNTSVSDMLANWTLDTLLNNGTSAPTSALTMGPTQVYDEDKTIIYFTVGSYKGIASAAKNQLSRIPSYYNTSFMVHLGDWNEANNTQCDEQSYIDVSNFYQNSSVPVYFVMGDNDFTDCVDPVQAKQHWVDYLGDYASKYWKDPDWVVWKEGNQGNEYSDYYENFDFYNNRNVAFVSLSVPGGSVNTGGDENNVEFLDREDANFAWLDASYEFYRGTVDVLVVMLHDAMPGSNIANRLFFTMLLEKIESDYADMNFLFVNRNTDDDDTSIAPSHQLFRQYYGIQNLHVLSVGGPVWPPLQLTIETNGDGIMPNMTFDGSAWYYDLWGIRDPYN